MSSRRRFIHHSILAAAGINTFLLSRCKDLTVQSKSEATDVFNLDEVTIESLQKMYSAGSTSAEKVTQAYLERIAAIDQAGIKLNAIIEINPDALLIAKALDAERKAGTIRGPLHGIPILIKDNINTADKMMTTAGALALVGNIASKDAFIVEKLRQAGVVLLGKTNLSEWANFRSTRSSSGWSSRGGQTKNPYVLDYSPCGSSSGSGSAVSANLCTIAIGTETDGSVACPASINGVVGIKPTVGLWSRSGIIPISHTQDTAGPMARTVTDAAVLLTALQGKDPQDEATNANPDSGLNYAKDLNLATMQGMRLGIDASLLKRHEEIDDLLGKTKFDIKL